MSAYDEGLSDGVEDDANTYDVHKKDHMYAAEAGEAAHIIVGAVWYKRLYNITTHTHEEIGLMGQIDIDTPIDLSNTDGIYAVLTRVVRQVDAMHERQQEERAETHQWIDTHVQTTRHIEERLHRATRELETAEAKLTAYRAMLSNLVAFCAANGLTEPALKIEEELQNFPF